MLHLDGLLDQLQSFASKERHHRHIYCSLGFFKVFSVSTPEERISVVKQTEELLYFLRRICSLWDTLYWQIGGSTNLVFEGAKLSNLKATIDRAAATKDSIPV